MASLSEIGGFNANEIEPNEGFDLLPSGVYVAAITDSEWKATNAGDGKYVSLTFTIVEGQREGRKLWVNLNLVNKNPEAVKIAKGDLSAICRACGIMVPDDTAALHDIPLVITVGAKKNKNSGELQNVIKKYERKGAVQAAGGAVTGSKPQQTASGDKSKPWLKS